MKVMLLLFADDDAIELLRFPVESYKGEGKISFLYGHQGSTIWAVSSLELD